MSDVENVRPLSKRQKAKAATREKVLTAARVCFNSLGYERATIRDIANTAGMSTGAVFASFTGKEALYAEIYGRPPLSPEVGSALLAALKGLLQIEEARISTGAFKPNSYGAAVIAEARAAIAKATGPQTASQVPGKPSDSKAA